MKAAHERTELLALLARRQKFDDRNPRALLGTVQEARIHQRLVGRGEAEHAERIGDARQHERGQNLARIVEHVLDEIDLGAELLEKLDPVRTIAATSGAMLGKTERRAVGDAQAGQIALQCRDEIEVAVPGKA